MTIFAVEFLDFAPAVCFSVSLSDIVIGLAKSTSNILFRYVFICCFTCHFGEGVCLMTAPLPIFYLILFRPNLYKI
jgi:hypothetical protein